MFTRMRADVSAASGCDKVARWRLFAAVAAEIQIATGAARGIRLQDRPEQQHGAQRDGKHLPGVLLRIGDEARSMGPEQQLGHHFSDALTDVNFVLSVGPRACTLTMM